MAGKIIKEPRAIYLGKKLLARRKELGIAQRVITERVGMHRTLYAQYEAGLDPYMGYKSISRLAEALDLDELDVYRWTRVTEFSKESLTLEEIHKYNQAKCLSDAILRQRIYHQAGSSARSGHSRVGSDLERKLSLEPNDLVNLDVLRDVLRRASVDPQELFPLALGLVSKPLNPDEERYRSQFLGSLIREKREEFTLSFSALARLAGVTEIVVSRVESGKDTLHAPLLEAPLAFEPGYFDKVYTETFGPDPHGIFCLQCRSEWSRYRLSCTCGAER